MGNSSDKEKQSRISNARFKSKVKEFLDKYGSIRGQEAKQWIDRTIAENFNSVTYTKFADPTYRKSRQDLLQAFERAYKGKWRPTLISFEDVNSKKGKEIIQFKYQNNVPYVKNPGQRINLFFQGTAIFDEQTRLWTNSTHKQYGYELEPYTANRTYSQPSTYSAPTTYSQPTTYPSSTTNTNYINEQKKRQDESKRQREAVERDRVSREQAQRARREVEERNERYRQAQKRNRENIKRQQDAQRQYRRQQQMQAEQRRRQYQQALSNRKY